MSLVLTTWGRQQMVSAFWTPDIFTPLADVYLAYTATVAPANADGSQLDEPDPTAGYVRVAYPLASAKWAPSGFGEIYNLEERIFPAITADWGLIQGMALVDSSVIGAGNVIAVGNVVEPYAGYVGLIPTVAIGDVTIGLYE